jgi:hypothetical protein
MPAFARLTDSKFSTAVGNFIHVAAANLLALGLTQAEIDNLAIAKEKLDESIAASVAAKQTAIAANTARRECRKSTFVELTLCMRRIVALGAAPDSLVRQLGMAVRARSYSRRNVYPVMRLVATVDGGSINRLRWDRGENQKDVLFLIEARYDGEAEFRYAGTTTRCRFNHGEQVPGRRVTYRVRAGRSDIRGECSNLAVVYDAA